VILGVLDGYEARDVRSSEGVGLPLAASVRVGTSGDRHHEVNYRRVGRRGGSIAIDVSVSEVADPTWLQHELEHYIRRIPKPIGYVLEVEEIAGQHVISFAEGVSTRYLWVSGGSRGVYIRAGTLSEIIPESFVAAYLQRLPSDLPAFQFDDAHERQWIRDEIDRQFYYLDKILAVLVTAARDERGGVVAMIDQRLGEIARLRGQYFGGPTEEEWEREVVEQVRQQFPGADGSVFDAQPQVEARVNELKQWWAQHRDDPILLPTPTAMPTPANTPTP
jgi:hypothetical protein